MAGTRDRDTSDRVVIVFVGLVVLLAPAVILTLTLVFLSYTGNLVLGRVTLLELFELYLIELLLLAGVSYLLYRLLSRLVVHTLPASMDAVDETEDEGERDP